jgi:hypothetical protein
VIAVMWRRTVVMLMPELQADQRQQFEQFSAAGLDSLTVVSAPHRGYQAPSTLPARRCAVDGRSK